MPRSSGSRSPRRSRSRDRDEPRRSDARRSSSTGRTGRHDPSASPVRAKGAQGSESMWVILENLPRKVSWNKVRGLFSEHGATVASGRVIRADNVALVRLTEGDDPSRMVKELDDIEFKDVPGCKVSAKSVSEKVGNKMMCS
uniref:RRM domain-containing protein n=1 Tax=Noctiluca scintillans TaxID=2966 RepID=A0A7S0ZML0_NOCSC